MIEGKTTRRGFLNRSVAACLAAPAARAALPQGRRPDGAARLNWFLAVQSYTFRDIGFLDTIDRCSELRLRFIEGWPGHPIGEDYPDLKLDVNNPEAMAPVQKKLAERRLMVPAYGVTPVPDKEDAARAFLENCKKIGVLVVVTETPPTRMHDTLCNELGLYIALHNHPDTWPPEKVLEACKGLSPRVGACADTGHWVRRGLDPVETLRKLKGRIVSLHLKDLTDEKKDAPWGAGKSNLKAQLAELKDQGFKGFISIEYEGSRGPDLVDSVRKCAEFFREAAAGLAG